MCRIFLHFLRVTLKRTLCVLLFCAVSLQALLPQESPSSQSPGFAEIESDLEKLENLITDTLSNNEQLSLQLRDLEENLNEHETLLSGKEALIDRQENLLRELGTRLESMSQIYREQSLLSKKSARSSKFWKTFTIIGIPAAALLSGGVTAAVLLRGR